MQKFGPPERFTHMVRQLHDRMMALVTDNGAIFEAFAVTNGVWRGCLPAPTILILVLSAMLMDAYHDEHLEIRIDHRTDAYLLNSRRMKALTSRSTTTIYDLHSADDCALNSKTEEDMQRSIYILAFSYAHFGLTINTDKTVIMHQQPPTAEYNGPHIRVNGNELKTVDNFKYLGSTKSLCIRIDDEVAYRIAKPSAGCRTPCGIATTSY
nr:unnamed protein product [Spirometra erinaceieuropaei]